MCGRYDLQATSEDLLEAFRLLRTPSDFSPRYNIAPTQGVIAVRGAEGANEAVLLRWGLIPFWAKDAKIAARMINARAETIQEKPAFRTAFRRRRCLVPASGFFEWKASVNRSKQPFRIHHRDDQLLAFAGLWESWKNAETAIESCTIITTDANELMRPIHDRMPVILRKTDWDAWLNPESSPDSLSDLLIPFGGDDLVAEPVSTVVNSVRNDSPECVKSVELN